jgi:hypothetical protein
VGHVGHFLLCRFHLRLNFLAAEWTDSAEGLAIAMKAIKVLRSKRFKGWTAFEAPGVGNPGRNLLNFTRWRGPNDNLRSTRLQSFTDDHIA